MARGPHILAVGDIHGRADLLARVLGEILPQTPPETRLVFLGDYIDRGPQSAQVVEALIEFKARRPDTVFLLGNHEWMLLEALAGRLLDMFFLNGGEATLDSYGLDIETMYRLPQNTWISSIPWNTPSRPKSTYTCTPGSSPGPGWPRKNRTICSGYARSSSTRPMISGGR